MIAKIIKKFISYFFLAIAVFGNTGLFSLVKTKEVEKEAFVKKPSFVFEEKLQCATKEKFFNYYNYKNLVIKKSAPSLTYNSYRNERSIPFGFPQPEQSTYSYVILNLDSSAMAYPVVINLDYTTNTTHTAINEIQNISIDIKEPKEFLARNLNEEWKESIEFYSKHYDFPRKI